MTKQTLLFYDLETTGLNPCFDQVLQFAAIRTDKSLNEIDRIEYRIKLDPDVIPAPEALLTHKIGIHDCLSGISSHDAILAIHRELNCPGTISLGYNTLGFDDEFLRFSFYRNLLPPYTHQFANQCSRMDIYPLIQLYYLFQPNILEWPRKEENRVSLKLEDLNAANQLASGQAHDAMVDVEVTLALAKKLQSAKQMWDYALGYFSKEVDTKRLNALQHRGIMINTRFGQAAQYMAPVLHIGQHQVYKNQSLWIRLDDPNLPLIKEDISSVFPIKKRMGEPPIILPINDRFSKKLSEEQLTRYQQNLAFLEKEPKLFSAFTTHVLNDTPETIESIDADAALYDIGFPSRHETELYASFTESDLEGMIKMLPSIQHPVRREQAIRIIGRINSSALDPESESLFNAYLQDRKNGSGKPDFRNNTSLSAGEALTRIEELLSDTSLNDSDTNVLKDYKAYLSKESHA